MIELAKQYGRYGCRDYGDVEDGEWITNGSRDLHPLLEGAVLPE